MHALAAGLRCLMGISVALLATASAAAFDIDAAAAAFDASRTKMKSSGPVLEGWSGNDSHVAVYSVERVSDLAAWRDAWARHAPGTKAPDIDFSKAFAVAIFVGAVDPSVVPEVSLSDVVENEKIDLTTMNYMNDVISGKRINPYLLIVLRRSPKPVRVFARTCGLMRAPQEETVLLEEFGAIPPSK